MTSAYDAADVSAEVAPFFQDIARRISEVSPDGFSKVFFTNGGADANENAVRMARDNGLPARAARTER